MRILHIVGTISPAAGGPTEVIKMLVRYAPAGFENELVTTDDPAAPFLADLPFPVHALGTAQKSWYCPRLIPWLRANRDRFDGIIVHGLWEFTGLAVRLAHGNTPYVVFPHGMLDPYFKRRYPAKHAKKWVYWLLAEYWVLRGARRALFTTAVERDLATQSFWLHRWTPMVTALGTEPPPRDTERLLAAFYERWPQLKDKRFLLFLGRIDPKKGCDLLLQAFAAIAQHDPQLCLVLAGPFDKDYKRKLEQESLNGSSEMRVHWPGILLGDAKWGALAACEAFVLTSHQENFGIAVVEALASGKPVLISDQINIAPDIAGDGAGLVEPDTLEGATRLLERWQATTPAEREAISQQARATFAARYDMRRNTAAILSVFSSKGQSSGQRTKHEPTAPYPQPNP
jgi:glycosyltransferase involved in cell wall biosynthesis